MSTIATMGVTLLILAVLVGVGMVLIEYRLNRPESLREQVERAEREVQVPEGQAGDPLAAHTLAKEQVMAEAAQVAEAATEALADEGGDELSPRQRVRRPRNQGGRFVRKPGGKGDA